MLGRLRETVKGRFDVGVHTMACRSLLGLCHALADAGEVEAAADALEEALGVTRAHLGPGDVVCRQVESAASRVYSKHPRMDVRKKGLDLASKLVEVRNGMLTAYVAAGRGAGEREGCLLGQRRDIGGEGRGRPWKGRTMD